MCQPIPLAGGKDFFVSNEIFEMISESSNRVCDACGLPFVRDEWADEWEDRCSHHEPGCPFNDDDDDGDPDMEEYSDLDRALDPILGCDCDLNYHESCCPVCNAPRDDPFTDMSQVAILERVRAGTTTEEDAFRLFRWLNPPKQERIVSAYLTLVCDADAAREFIALDLREGLARRLLEDAPQSATYVPVENEQVKCACPEECGFTIQARGGGGILYLTLDHGCEYFHLPDGYRLCRVEGGGKNLAQTRKLE
jgi:hypothetical protein